MLTLYIGNAFSLSMLDRETQARSPGDCLDGARWPRPCPDPVAHLELCELTGGVQIISAVGHTDTAALFSTILDRPIAVNRVSVKLDNNSAILIGQYQGPLWPEGATTLPEGASIDWWLV
jgi:hypothetical protein